MSNWDSGAVLPIAAAASAVFASSRASVLTSLGCQTPDPLAALRGDPMASLLNVA
ncbi:hypothetical protein AB0D32_29580 [Micromonospora sp. NPDC048170]|uniref:hypothetical protein n=1 Tax=Micromonospora sp. NPDC048170 TaxID=3154819 RepID=UPI0033CEB3C9